MKINNLKTVSLSALALTFLLPTALIASSQGSTPPLTEEREKKPTVPQKVGKESAKIVGQVEGAAKDIASAFKKKRHQDKAKNKK